MNDKLKVYETDDSCVLMKLSEYAQDGTDYAPVFKSVIVHIHKKCPTVKDAVYFLNSSACDGIGVNVNYMDIVRAAVKNSLAVEKDDSGNDEFAGTFRYRDTVIVMDKVESIDVVSVTSPNGFGYSGHENYDVRVTFESGRTRRLEVIPRTREVSDMVVNRMRKLMSRIE